MLVVTLGDPHSISIAVISRLLDDITQPLAFPLVLVGSRWHWDEQRKRLGIASSPLASAPVRRLEELREPGIYFLNSGGPHIPAEDCSPEERGHIATASLRTLEGFKPRGPLAVLTCPINKRNCALAGFTDVGQTEFFQRIWDKRAVMVLAGPQVRVGLVTNHIALGTVSSSLSRDLVAAKLSLFYHTLRETFGIAAPRIAVCGLNPHNGEGGLCSLGEEESIILPVVAEQALLTGEGSIAGPFPADTIFWQARQGRWDGVLAMYHDQGLGPFKTLHFDDGINVSGGLPYLRVSPDHGPVSDFYLREGASAASFRRAWQFAWDYLGRKDRG